MKKTIHRQWKRAELREPTLRLLDEEGVKSGNWGACTIDSQWLIDRGFPAAFVLPMVEEFGYEPGNPHTLIIKYAPDGSPYRVGHVRAVCILNVLWTLAGVFGADTKAADGQFGRKSSARLLAAGIKKAITDEGAEKLEAMKGQE
jgi:hypothetical protein